MNSPPARSGKVSLVKRSEAPAASEAPPSASAAAYGDGLSLVAARNDFYRSNYIKLVKIFSLQVLSVALMIAVNLRLLEFTDSQDYFFPVQADNSLIFDRPMSDPFYSEAEITAWAEKAVTESFTFAFYDHATRLQEARNYFTTMGFANFLKALDSADILKKIGAIPGQVSDEQVMRARVRPNESTQITYQGLAGGYYVWKIRVGINLTFVGRKIENRERLDIEVLIVRIPLTMGRYGIGIDQVLAERKE